MWTDHLDNELSAVTVSVCIISLFNTLTYLAGLVLIKAIPL